MANSISNKNIREGTQGICMVAMIPLRSTPHEQSEMTSQILFGELYDVIEVSEKWLKIIALFDQFTGWIDRKFFCEINSENGTGIKMHAVLYSRLAEIDMPDGTRQLISAGSTLPGFDHLTNEFTIEKQRFRLRPVFGDKVICQEQNMPETALRFVNTPYLWGGRSVFGFDCSGFIQILFKIHGQSLQRDTGQQISGGQEISLLTDAVAGDLAFFSNRKGNINHVGMLLSGGEIIHCSGWVRIDRLDEKGIFNREQGVYTHRLFQVRRMNGQ